MSTKLEFLTLHPQCKISIPSTLVMSENSPKDGLFSLSWMPDLIFRGRSCLWGQSTDSQELQYLDTWILS
jgi:hypothetical protein